MILCANCQWLNPNAKVSSRLVLSFSPEGANLVCFGTTRTDSQWHEHSGLPDLLVFFCIPARLVANLLVFTGSAHQDDDSDHHAEDGDSGSDVASQVYALDQPPDASPATLGSECLMLSLMAWTMCVCKRHKRCCRTTHATLPAFSNT